MKAFPFNFRDKETQLVVEPGMDLRDYFAAKAIPISYQIWKDYFFSDENDSTYKTSSFEMDEEYPNLIADTAYELADAMMKARANHD